MKSKKKTAVGIIAIAFTLIAVLLILNFADFSSVGNKRKEKDSLPEYTERYFDDRHYELPDYDLDIMTDPSYLSKDRLMYYTVSGETMVYELSSALSDRYCIFFADYLNAVINGNASMLNSLLTDNYKETRGEYKSFTMQKVYDISISLDSKHFIDDGKEYNGFTRSVFDVRYKILDNNGTFRRDILEDDELPLLFELLDDGKEIKLNSISHYRYYTPSDENGGILESILPLISGIFFIIFGAIEIFTRRFYSLSLSLSFLISFVLAICSATALLQIIAFVLSLTLFSPLAYILRKRKKSKI